MKVFWVLAWDIYYPDEGLNNVNSQWSTLKEAEDAAESLMNKREYDYVKIQDVSDMLGIERNT